MDKRKHNGGNSTKAKGVDKRKNEYKEAIQMASTIDEVVDVINVVKANAKSGDLQACKLFLEYYLGKPMQTADVTSNGETISMPSINFTSSE